MSSNTDEKKKTETVRGERENKTLKKNCRFLAEGSVVMSESKGVFGMMRHQFNILVEVSALCRIVWLFRISSRLRRRFLRVRCLIISTL